MDTVGCQPGAQKALLIGQGSGGVGKGQGWIVAAELPQKAVQPGQLPVDLLRRNRKAPIGLVCRICNRVDRLDEDPCFRGCCKHRIDQAAVLAQVSLRMLGKSHDSVQSERQNQHLRTGFCGKFRYGAGRAVRAFQGT